MRPEDRRAADVVFDQHPWGYALLFGAVLCPVAAAAGAMLLVHDLDATVPLFWGVGFGVLGLYFAGRWGLGARVLADERAWLASLGFEVNGWFDVIGVEVPHDGKLRVTLEFRGTPPDAIELESWLGAVGAERASGSSWSFISPRISARAGTRGSSFTTRYYLAWQKRLVKRVLIPIHAKYPLARVQVSAVRR